MHTQTISSVYQVICYHDKVPVPVSGVGHVNEVVSPLQLARCNQGTNTDGVKMGETFVILPLALEDFTKVFVVPLQYLEIASVGTCLLYHHQHQSLKCQRDV